MTRNSISNQRKKQLYETRSLIQKPADWHIYDPEMTIEKLVIQECLHEVDGRFPITLTCDKLGGDILLEIVRKEDQLLAIYYFSEKSAHLWAEKCGFTFVEQGWQVIESSKGVHPYVAGKVVSRTSPQQLGIAVELSFDCLMPDEVKTGIFADENYICPVS